MWTDLYFCNDFGSIYWTSMTWMNGSWVKGINLVLITVIGVSVNVAKSQNVFSIHIIQSLLELTKLLFDCQVELGKQYDWQTLISFIHLKMGRKWKYLLRFILPLLAHKGGQIKKNSGNIFSKSASGQWLGKKPARGEVFAHLSTLTQSNEGCYLLTEICTLSYEK